MSLGGFMCPAENFALGFRARDRLPLINLAMFHSNYAVDQTGKFFLPMGDDEYRHVAM